MTEIAQGPERPAKPSTPAAKRAARGAAAAPARISPWYLAVVGLSGVATLAAFYLALMGLQTTRNLPPPAFSNSLCVDEKLEVLRTRPVASPNLLVIGSSIAWRQFDGEAVKAVAPKVEPLNGGFCGLLANQSTFVAGWLLDRHPSVRDVLMIASPLDFEDCTGKPTAVFNRQDVDEFVYGGASRWPYYTRYFDPLSLARNAATIAQKRSGENAVDPLVFDRYGSGPLRTAEFRGLLYGALNRQDPACFKAVADLSRRLKREGRRLMIVAAPLHSQWKIVGDNAALIAEFDKGLSSIPDAEFWNGDSLRVPDSAFFDAVHLRWSEVDDFSAAMARQFHF